MTPEKQRIAIAEACGWRFLGDDRSNPRFDYHNDWIGNERFPPDYLNDLNAMHEAEKVLTDERYERFEEHLCCIWDSENPIDVYNRWTSATAAQRAEAFLRTIGKWEESTTSKF